MKLMGKTALVTGAARGIGRGCALELARAGADVAINDRNADEHLASLADEIHSLGRKSLVVAGDVFDHDTCGRLVDQVVAAWGAIDILVSNPALSRRNAFLDTPRDEFDRTLRGTLSSGFSMSQHAARRMVARGRGGAIVFISSVHARMPYADSAAYNAAKAGLNHMARTIAAELAADRIHVNVIEPGWIDTPGERRTFGDDVVQRSGAALPWGRLGTPADIGKAAAFLASDDADYITGATLVVDGGFLLRDALPARHRPAESLRLVPKRDESDA
ncbi:MAG: glucose 1-dehydrogenase [Planctomycetes bacterium]|nr:glucose 1-dehydrogenase [Planctomycetota bacterium]